MSLKLKRALSLFGVLGVLTGVEHVLAQQPASEAAKPKASQNRVLTAMSTTLSSGHPLLVLAGSRPMQFFESQRYSKWSVLFESPVRIDEVRVETCDPKKSFEDGVELFLGLDDTRLFAEGGRSLIKFSIPRSRSRNEVRALTLGFLESQGLCLKSIAFFTDGKPTDLIVPEVLDAKGWTELGDGRIDFDGLAMPRTPRSDLRWERNLIVDGLRVWNGNQAAGDRYLEAPRARVLEVSVLDEKGKERGEKQKWNLEDRRGFQKFEWPQPATARGLKMEVRENFPPIGSMSSTAKTLSEVQLLAGGTVWVPGVVDASTEGETTSLAARLRFEEFKARGFDEILDRELRTETVRGRKTSKNSEIWQFRFRGDGTVAAKVFTDRARTAKTWTFLGTWNLVTASEFPVPALSVGPTPESTPNKTKKRRKSLMTKYRESAEPLVGIGLRVVGVRYATPEFADSLPCGNQCFSSNSERGPATARELPVNEFLEIQLGESKNQFYLRNRSLKDARTLDFTDLKLRLHTVLD